VFGRIENLFAVDVIQQRFFDLSVRFTRRTATVTMSAPEAACARAISENCRVLPVPTIRRELNARPAMTNYPAWVTSKGF